MKGFTLIETLIYISLFGLLLSGAVVSAYQILDGGARMKQALAVQEEGNFLLQKLDWEVGQADSASIENGALVLQPGTIVFSELDGRMAVSRGSEEALPVTAAALAVTSTEFEVSSPGSEPVRVNATFDIEGTRFVFEKELEN
ncbi:MAG TPA: type II secretion system protein [Candidatus Paceibacterota bacterium]|nr:type II secretion system protein [Candidatus Paceibacterota bacterium]